VVEEMARIVKKDGRVCITELDTRARNEAEEIYIRLHKESGDCLFEPEEILRAMERARLASVKVLESETDIWFSPELAKQNLQFAQVWFDADVERSLGALIDRFGMKYPAFLTFSGKKSGP
jgi:ubiquinone/menaquinone biosynthesis C-methylase UbiE